MSQFIISLQHLAGHITLLWHAVILFVHISLLVAIIFLPTAVFRFCPARPYEVSMAAILANELC